MHAREMQMKRFDKTGYEFNSQLDSKAVDKYCALDADVQKEFDQIAAKKQFSARAYYRTLKVARTIADLEDSDSIEINHLLEAMCYRDEKWLG